MNLDSTTTEWGGLLSEVPTFPSVAVAFFIWGLWPLRTAAIVSGDTRYSLLTGAACTLNPQSIAEVACPQLLNDMVSLSLCLSSVAIIHKSQLLQQATGFTLFFFVSQHRHCISGVSVRESVFLSFFLWTAGMHSGHPSSGHI